MFIKGAALLPGEHSYKLQYDALEYELKSLSVLLTLYYVLCYDFRFTFPFNTFSETIFKLKSSFINTYFLLSFVGENSKSNITVTNHTSKWCRNKNNIFNILLIWPCYFSGPTN